MLGLDLVGVPAAELLRGHVPLRAGVVVDRVCSVELEVDAIPGRRPVRVPRVGVHELGQGLVEGAPRHVVRDQVTPVDVVLVGAGVEHERGEGIHVRRHLDLRVVGPAVAAVSHGLEAHHDGVRDRRLGRVGMPAEHRQARELARRHREGVGDRAPTDAVANEDEPAEALADLVEALDQITIERVEGDVVAALGPVARRDQVEDDRVEAQVAHGLVRAVDLEVALALRHVALEAEAVHEHAGQVGLVGPVDARRGAVPQDHELTGPVLLGRRRGVAPEASATQAQQGDHQQGTELVHSRLLFLWQFSPQYSYTRDLKEIKDIE